MTQIKTLNLKNFKRQNVTEKLTGKDIFIGPNGIGKSSRIQSLGTALIGYVPGSSGKRPQDTFRVATGDEMSISVETDAFGFTRSFIRKSKNKRDGSRDVSVSQELSVSPSKGEKTLKEKEARIAEEMGSFPVMLDFDAFLSMSDSDRRSFFYNLAGIDSNQWTKGSIAETLERKLLTDILRDNNPEAYEAQEITINEALAEWRGTIDPESGVKAMLEWSKSKQKHWNAEKRKAIGAVQKLAELKNQLEETDRHINENREELERLQLELTTISSDIARQEEAKKAIDQRLARIKELKQKEETLSSPSSEFKPEEAEKAIELLKGKIINDENVDEQAAAFTSQMNDIQEQLNGIEKYISETSKIEAMANAKAEGLVQTIKQASERGGICVISPNIGCDKDFTPFIGWAQEHQNEYLAQASHASQRLKELEQERKNLREQGLKLQKKRDAVYSKSREAQRQNEAIQKQIRNLERQIDQFKSSEDIRQQRLADTKEELIKLESQPIESVAGNDILLKQKDGITEQIKTLKAKITEQEKARTTITNMKSSMIDSSTADNYHAASKYLTQELGPKGIQGDMLVSSLGPIRDDVTANLKKMGIDFPFFFETESDRGQEVFRFGWVDDNDNQVDFDDALSTGQQMMVLIALMVTILDRANPACKVLAIDNIENLDSSNFKSVLAGLDKLSDRLDNIILAGVLSLEDAEGWNIHRLGDIAGEVVA